MELTYKNILVAVDGSDESNVALHKAINVAQRNDSKLIITHIAELILYTGGIYDSTFQESALTFGEELLQKCKKIAEDAGLTSIDTYLGHGSPKVTISKDVALQVNADLIICGAHGANAVERLFIGSVSENIVRSAKCDVLIVKTK